MNLARANPRLLICHQPHSHLTCEIGDQVLYGAPGNLRFAIRVVATNGGAGGVLVHAVGVIEYH